MRILAEYLEPLRRFRDETDPGHGRLLRVGARDSRERAERALRDAPGRPRAPARRRGRRARRRAGRSTGRVTTRTRATLARAADDVERCTLDTPHHRFVVCSGGGPGIMEAANRGAREAGGKTIGLNIRLPFEQGANPYVTDEPALRVPLLLHAEVLVRLPGQGAGRLSGRVRHVDELFEILTLAQTDKLSKKIEVLLYGREYWDRVLHFEPMVECGRDLGRTTSIAASRSSTRRSRRSTA